jgi:23S rRNA (uracil1939-C5)-methyltransferase
MADPVVRIAARGDGVTAAGRYVPFAVPGDRLLDDGSVQAGPHRQVPPCRHFPECGGCELQHADDEAYCGYLLDRVGSALAQHDLKTEIRQPHLSPPNSRRRASLKALKAGGGVAIGFHAEKSHRIVDMRECHILRPELFALVQPLRQLLGTLPPRTPAEIQMSLADQGADVAVKGLEPDGLDAVERLTAFCVGQGLARLSLDQGLGLETFFEPEPVTVTLGGRPVPFPAGSFLQATADGEAALVEAVREAVGGAGRIADLFAGLGTFALALDGQIHAAEAARDAVLALKRAAPHVWVEHRDLYRRPLDSAELERLDALVIDPPRAGAAGQVQKLAGSSVARVAYVSCNPATFARDARLLVDGGFRLLWVRPVGQFRWSTHVELAAAFAR